MKLPDLCRDRVFVEEMLRSAHRDGDPEVVESAFRLMLAIDPDLAVRILAELDRPIDVERRSAA